MEAVVALREIAPFEDDEEKHLREREAQQREVDAVEAYHEQADERRNERHERHRYEQREPKIGMRGKKARDRQQRHVGPDAVKCRLPVGK